MIQSSSNLIELCENMKLTKRNRLKIIVKFFHPLGMLSPLTVGMKVMFQEVYQSKFDWDEPMSEALRERWRKWLSSLKEVRSVHLARCTYDGISEKDVSYELHGFGDASNQAYCAMVYLASYGLANVKVISLIFPINCLNAQLEI